MSKIEIPIITGGMYSVFNTVPLVPINFSPINPKPLGTAIWPKITETVNSISSITFDSDINYVSSDKIRFVYPLTPVGPLYDTVEYDSVDDDIKFRTKVTKKFYERVFNSYLYKKDDLLNYFKVINNKVKLVKSQKEYNNNELSYTDKSIVIDFILNNIYDKYDLKKSLKKFLRRTNTKWLDLIDYKSDVKNLIFRDIKRKIKQFFKKN